MSLVQFDRAEIERLLGLLDERLGLGSDTADYADLLEPVYRGEGALPLVLGVPDDQARDEALNRGDIAVSLVRRAKD